MLSYPSIQSSFWRLSWLPWHYLDITYSILSGTGTNPPVSFDLRPLTSDLRPQTSDFRHPTTCLYCRSVYTLSLSWCHWPVPLASHPPTQLTKSWIGGCLYICRCNAKPFIYDSTSSILLLTYHIYSALPSPILRAHLSRTLWTLQIQSPSGTQPSRYDM